MNSLTKRDYLELLLLSALWGSSFLFLRISAPVFGPVFLIELRVVSGFLVLLPLCFWMGKQHEIIRHWRMIMLAGLTNMAVPFCFFAYAALHAGAGLLSIVNATVPFYTAIIAFVFFGQRLSALAIGGMLIGFSGVVVLVFDPASTSYGEDWRLGVVAAMFACLLYGSAINLVAYRLQGVSGLSITAGSLFFSSIALLPFAFWQRPAELPQGPVWLAVLALGIVCTGFGYILFYRLIARIGSHRAIMTAYLIPLFSLLWGSLFLEESITLAMIAGALLVLSGVAMTTGKLPKFRFGVRNKIR